MNKTIDVNKYRLQCGLTCCFRYNHYYYKSYFYYNTRFYLTKAIVCVFCLYLNWYTVTH